MSTNLEWEPARRKRKELGTGLKWALQKKYGHPVRHTFTQADVPFLEGVVAAADDKETGKDAQKLIDAITQYEEVFVEEC